VHQRLALLTQNESVFDTTMKAVIIYDRFDFAVKAKAMLECAAQRTDETSQWSVRPWGTDILKLPTAAEVALEDAVGAHLILLAVGQVQSLLLWLGDWLRGGPNAGKSRRRPWPYGMVQTPKQVRRERPPSCHSLPGTMA
jgi:hypothetical protein